MPTFNSAKTVSSSIDSIFGQDYPSFELIIIDDGSTDETISILEEYEKKYSDCITILSQSNKGPAAARNAGIAIAKGAYIAFLDSDDIWHPSKLSVQLKALSDRPEAGLCHTGARHIDHEGVVFKEAPVDMTYDGECFHNMIQLNGIVTSATLIHRHVIDNCGTFDDSFFTRSDWEYWIRVSHAYPFVAVPDLLIDYRVHPGNISNNIDQNYIDHLAIIEKSASTLPNTAEIKASIKRAKYFLYYRYAIRYYRRSELKRSRREIGNAIKIAPYRLGAWKVAIKILLLSVVGGRQFENVQ